MSVVKFNRRSPNSVPYFSDVFDSLFNDSFHRNYSNKKNPQVNISEDDKAYHLALVAPGWQKADFKIAVKNGQLIVGAEKATEKVEDQKNFSRREFELSTFERSFVLPENINQDDISASYESGVLEIIIHKKELVKEVAKQILVG